MSAVIAVAPTVWLVTDRDARGEPLSMRPLRNAEQIVEVDGSMHWRHGDRRYRADDIVQRPVAGAMVYLAGRVVDVDWGESHATITIKVPRDAVVESNDERLLAPRFVYPDQP